MNAPISYVPTRKYYPQTRITAIMGELSLPMCDGLRRFIDEKPIFMTGQNTLDALERRHIIERYLADRVVNGVIVARHTAYRLTWLGYELAWEFGFMGGYTYRAAMLDLDTRALAAIEKLPEADREVMTERWERGLITLEELEACPMCLGIRFIENENGEGGRPCPMCSKELDPDNDPTPLSGETVRKHGAVSAHCFFELEGVEFFVRRLNWGSSVEYQVYERAASTMGDHYSITHENGKLWGEVNSYFVDAQWAHLRAWSHERRANVTSYREFREAIADQIAMLAFPYDMLGGYQVHDGFRVWHKAQ